MGRHIWLVGVEKFGTRAKLCTLEVNGVLWAKRAMNAGKGPKYIAVCEHEGIDVQHSEAYRKVAQTEWTWRIKPHLSRRERKIYELL